MNLRKRFTFLLVLMFLLSLMSVNVSAAEKPEFYYELSVDGKDTVEVEPGELITVTLYLHRTDSDDNYTMYAMQDEIRYDSSFFELVEDSPLLSKGIKSNDIGVASDLREFYMSFLSFSGGENWQQKTRIGSIQLKVIGTSGTSKITNEDYLVSLPGGDGSYECEANALTVIVSSECVVKFETNGGTLIAPVTVVYGEKLDRPEDPSREGKYLVGWFKDIHLTQEWDFEKDTVTGNMTLYAKWADGKAPNDNSKNFFGNLHIDMSWVKNIPIVPIVVTLAALAIVFVLYRFLLIPLFDKRYMKYSLVNGDVEANYRNDKRKVHVSIAINTGVTSYMLGEGETSADEQRLRYIENMGRTAIAPLEPGKYDGIVTITDETSVLVTKCRIKVLNKKLK